MLRTIIWLSFFGLLVGGCASEGKTVSSDTSSSMTSGGAPAPAAGSTASGDAAMTSPPKSSAAASDSTAMSQAKATQNRIAAGVEEETLDSCLGRIPKDATAGQRMLAEQTCRRDFATRR